MQNESASENSQQSSADFESEFQSAVPPVLNRPAAGIHAGPGLFLHQDRSQPYFMGHFSITVSLRIRRGNRRAGVILRRGPNETSLTGILAEVSLIDFLKFSVTFKKCVKIDHPQIIYKSAKEITVESLSIPQPIDMDGEFIGYSPMNIKILSRVLSFLCPL